MEQMLELISKKIFKSIIIHSFSNFVSNYVYATAQNVVVKIKQDGGEILWEADIPSAHSKATYDIGSPIFDTSGNIYVLASNGDVSSLAMLYGIDADTGENIYQSEQFECPTYDVGSATAFVSETSFVVVCAETVAFFSA